MVIARAEAEERPKAEFGPGFRLGLGLEAGFLVLLRFMLLVLGGVRVTVFALGVEVAPEEGCDGWDDYTESEEGDDESFLIAPECTPVTSVKLGRVCS